MVRPRRLKETWRKFRNQISRWMANHTLQYTDVSRKNIRCLLHSDPKIPERILGGIQAIHSVVLCVCSCDQQKEWNHSDQLLNKMDYSSVRSPILFLLRNFSPSYLCYRSYKHAHTDHDMKSDKWETDRSLTELHAAKPWLFFRTHSL